MNKVVYAHYTEGGELFYIGKGSKVRAYSKHSRSRRWRMMSNEGKNFQVEILYDNLDDDTSDFIEKQLIIHFKRDKNSKLCNFCEGGLRESHWMQYAHKEDHPMYGKKNPKASIRMSNWNRERRGEKSPTYGKTRPDLAKLNKARSKRVKLVELDLEFNSGKEVAEFLGTTYFRPQVVDKPNRTFKGYHFKYV